MGRSSPAALRVGTATQEAFELALDALHDTELQKALFDRVTRQEAQREHMAVLMSIEDRSRPSRETYLLDLLRTTTEPIVRENAAFALAELRSRAGAAEIIQLLQDPKTKGARTCLLYALGQMNAAIEIDLLAQLIIEDDDEVQYECLLVIQAGRMHFSDKAAVEQALDKLQAASSADPSQRVYRRRYLRQVIDLLSHLRNLLSGPQTP